ncbi:MAG: N-succinylarginine dihydrolase [Planctomycetota bacterium]|nr:N-succinylarginine dihydrolase [Planctomycetota bacterium]
MSNDAVEVNFDGIVGPTHSYAGLSFGNLASQKHSLRPSSPRQAALQGLEKMKLLMDMGLKQGVLPPHERPNVATLRRLGFAGSDRQVLQEALQQAPAMLAACGSASAMWAANAATVSPSTDCADGRVHFTPANLSTQFHRSLEAPTTAAILRAIFPDESVFAHHTPLPAGTNFSDEGAANHTRLSAGYGQAGLELFVYGRNGFAHDDRAPTRFPARQTLEASQSIARLHQLDTANTHFVHQNPLAIDTGAFHNDVVAVGNLNVFLYHQLAFADSDSVERDLPAWFSKNGTELHLIKVTDKQVGLADAVSSYLFNSQLVSLSEGRMAMIAPTEARDFPASHQFLNSLVTRGTPIKEIHYIDVRQSMNNGGGPACLRLRVLLTPEEIARANSHVFLDKALYQKLRNWIQKHYRDRLLPADLADAGLLDESRRALDELTQILHLGSIYPFQQNIATGHP